MPPVCLVTEGPAFSPGVLAVICRCAEEEMVRSDTWRIIATVADEHPFGDWSIMERPRYAVCKDQRWMFSVPTDRTVARWQSIAGPLPTVTRPIHFCPEADFEGDGAALNVAGIAAKAFSASDLPGTDGHRLATVLALDRDGLLGSDNWGAVVARGGTVFLFCPRGCEGYAALDAGILRKHRRLPLRCRALGC